MADEILAVIDAFAAGLALGAAYCAMLWFAVLRLSTARRPIAGLLGGAVLRIGLLLGLFYLVTDGQWERLLACLAGFVAVRIAVTLWMSGRTAPRPTP